MLPDLWSLYPIMLRSRLYEEAITQFWNDGLISGEMHLGTGEEAIIAGIMSQLRQGDAVALDHRGTAAMVMRGVDPVLIIRELLGYSNGLCGGMGGHMHLFSKEHLAASSGIVGATGPTAVGFALAAQYLRPGSIAIAFFGDGSVNQGMLMESINLASIWKLPVLFVCKDDGWAITSQSKQMTGGNLVERVRGMGIPAFEVDGCNVIAMWKSANEAIEKARSGQGPTFLHAHCIHFEGHFLGFQLIRVIRAPLREIPGIAGPLTQSFLHPGGATLRERLAGLKIIVSVLLSTLRDSRQNLTNDPIHRARVILQVEEPARLQDLEFQIEKEIKQVLASISMEISS